MVGWALLLACGGGGMVEIALPDASYAIAEKPVGTGPDDIWLWGTVGTTGAAALHWDGHTWGTFPTPDGHAITTMRPAGPGDAWYIADNTVGMVHADGTFDDRTAEFPSNYMPINLVPGDTFAILIGAEDASDSHYGYRRLDDAGSTLIPATPPFPANYGGRVLADGSALIAGQANAIEAPGTYASYVELRDDVFTAFPANGDPLLGDLPMLSDAMHDPARVRAAWGYGPSDPTVRVGAFDGTVWSLITPPVPTSDDGTVLYNAITAFTQTEDADLVAVGVDTSDLPRGKRHLLLPIWGQSWDGSAWTDLRVIGRVPFCNGVACDYAGVNTVGTGILADGTVAFPPLDPDERNHLYLARY